MKRVLFCLFFISGFCSLLYQVIWIRKAFSSFGIITPVLSVVISVFMLGLSLGSWAGGKWVLPLRQRTKLSPLVFYGVAEVVIAIGALAVPVLFAFGEDLLLPLGETGSFQYLLFSAVIIVVSLLPWCLAMGLTFPFMMGFMKEAEPEDETGFSFLYFANVMGAMTGTVLTAVVLVEVLGFSNTLAMAGAFNLAIAAVCFWLSFRYPLKETGSIASPSEKMPVLENVPQGNGRMCRLILFITGFTSLAMEVTWTRAFTPVLGTKVYAFAMLLATYLFATWVGSRWYRKHLKTNQMVSTATLLSFCFFTSFFPVLANDPRLHASGFWALLSIFPFCAALGYLTPKLIDQFSLGNPKKAGGNYAVNIVGGIFGPLAAGYLLIPFLGVRFTLVLLGVPFLFLYFAYIRPKELATETSRRMLVPGMALAVSALFINTSYENPGFYYGEARILRDHTATVVAYGKDQQKMLSVNGRPVALLTNITKVMGHFPASIRSEKPESALVIALGAGTTFRSLASWGINVKAVELVPSVKQAVSFFFPDIPKIMEDPNVNIIIDDGRRFLKRTNERFDVITVDPPPPMEATGSSLLYSKEFYHLVTQRLKPDGIFHQWFPQGEKKILQGVARSLAEVFPHVRAYKSLTGRGYHFLVSMRPFETPRPEEMVERLPKAAKEDLLEWSGDTTLMEMAENILSREVSASQLMNLADENIFISDDQPFNEYYLIRRTRDKYNETFQHIY